MTKYKAHIFHYNKSGYSEFTMKGVSFKYNIMHPSDTIQVFYHNDFMVSAVTIKSSDILELNEKKY